MDASSVQKEWYPHTTLFTMTALHTLLLKWMLSTHFFHNYCYPSTSFKVNAIHMFLSKWPQYILFLYDVFYTNASSQMTALCGCFSPSTQKMLTRVEMELVAPCDAPQSTARKVVLKSNTFLSPLVGQSHENYWCVSLSMHFSIASSCRICKKWDKKLFTI